MPAHAVVNDEPGTEVAESNTGTGAGTESSPDKPRLEILDEVGRENYARQRLGLLPLGVALSSRMRLWGWLGPLLMTVLAALLRFPGLGGPDRIIFDETYYVKDAFTLDIYGYATEWSPVDPNDRNQFFNIGDYREMTSDPSYVVHGDVGKWLIALGMRLFGPSNPFGWRFSAAVTGTLAVFLLGRIAFRLFRNAPLATLAAGLLAIDGVGISMSRIGILDVFLTVFVLIGFWATLRARDAARARIAHQWAISEWWKFPLGPGGGAYLWLAVAGVSFGVAAGVKWSGFYAAAAVGIAVWLWDLHARRVLNVRRPFTGSIVKGAIPAFFALVPITIVAYVSTWFSWFMHPNAYLRQWAEEALARGDSVPISWAPNVVNSFLHYHLQMLEFHRTLDSPHTYGANPLLWLPQLRPTSMYWNEPVNDMDVCGASRCVGAMTSLGNPFIWWLGLGALVMVIYMSLKRSDARASFILAGYWGTFLPWLAFANRTVFSFYTIVIAPFVMLSVAYAAGLLIQALPLATRNAPSGGDTYLMMTPKRHSSVIGGFWDRFVYQLPRGKVWELALRFLPVRGDDALRASQRLGAAIVGIALAIIMMASLFWFPLWSGMMVNYWFWAAHMWLPSWV